MELLLREHVRRSRSLYSESLRLGLKEGEPMANGKVAEDLPAYKARWTGERTPGRASGIDLAERYGDERTARQLGAHRFIDPTPAERSSTPRKGKRKKATGRQRQR